MALSPNSCVSTGVPNVCTAALWDKFWSPCSQATCMRRYPAWGGGDSRVTVSELKDQAQPYWKKVKQTNKQNPCHTDSATSTLFELSFVFAFTAKHSTQWPWNHCLYTHFSYINSLTLSALSLTFLHSASVRVLKALTVIFTPLSICLTHLKAIPLRSGPSFLPHVLHLSPYPSPSF